MEKQRLIRSLVYIDIPTQSKVLFPVTQLLKESQKYSPLIYLDGSRHDLKSIQEECEENSYDYVLDTDNSIKRESLTSRSHEREPSQNTESKIAVKPRSFLIEFLSYSRFLKSTFRFFLRLLKENEIQLLLVTRDGIGHNYNILVKAAKRMNISVVIIPFTVANAVEPALKIYLDYNHRIKSGIARMVASIYSNWVYKFRGSKLLRLRAPHILASELFGFGTKQPWLDYSGNADFIAVESEFMKDYYLSENIPNAKLKFTGSLYEDKLTVNIKNGENEKRALFDKYGWDISKKLILCAFPPIYEGREKLLDQNYFYFKTLGELIDFWIDSLVSCSNAQVIINPHPRSKLKFMKHIEEKGVVIITDELVKLMPLCDIFVASMSATIRMAVACGKPVLNYDMNKYGYTDFIDIAGVITVEEKDQFEQELKKLTDQEEYYKQVEAAQIEKSNYFGTLDGKAKERTLKVLDDLFRN